MSIHPNRNERSQQLLRLNDARCELERANTVEQIKQVRERAESVRSYAQNAALGIEIQNFASELKLQAERMGGRILAAMRLRAGDRSEDESRRPRLREMGIDKNQSARWQLAATVPEPVFRRFLHEYHDTGREISSAALLRLAKRLREDPVDSVIVRSLDDCPSIATNSHLLALNWTSLETVGKDIDALADTVREACSHYQLMLNLIESICRKAKLTEETVEFRALQRYLIEIKRYLSTVDKSLQRLSRHPELNGFNSRHVSTGS